eukprot:CAMPEP_0117500224 /NCGR_PEP_ID=MMETSP0784-20121206/22666_1 /TAXON_ID=39447 /ORGANISM="" /LENGTH=500 /DNA_ID=CAMNT_0005295427 /DNA_START=62 /DNA_END=1565 /DNA_ORIENTATION=-
MVARSAAASSRALLCAPLLLASVAVSQQTPWQQMLMKHVTISARDRARQATPALLARLDSIDVRASLRECCPALGNASSEELLRRLKDEFAVSEVTSAFTARPSQLGPFHLHLLPALSDMQNASHFLGLWEEMLHYHDLRLLPAFFRTGIDNVEVKYYGLQPFARPAMPASPAEAQYRGVYSLVNFLRVDAGSPLYGDISVVFSPSFAKSAFILSAFDSGSWMNLCNNTGQPMLQEVSSFDYPHNCSAFPGHAGLGTMEHFEHLFAINENYWASASNLSLNLAQLFGGAPMRGIDFVQYVEAMSIGTIPFPDGVKFVLASFPSLFGTPEGTSLRAWCRKHGWLLLWALGPNRDLPTNPPAFWKIGRESGLFPGSPRILDPLLLSVVSANASAASRDVGFMEEAWQGVMGARARGHIPVAEWASKWAKLHSQMSPGLLVEPLRAGASEMWSGAWAWPWMATACAMSYGAHHMTALQHIWSSRMRPTQSSSERRRKRRHEGN